MYSFKVQDVRKRERGDQVPPNSILGEKEETTLSREEGEKEARSEAPRALELGGAMTLTACLGKIRTVTAREGACSRILLRGCV